MIIEDKWIIFETRTGMYYIGNNKDGMPEPKPLDSRVRLYRTQKAANCAIARISEMSEGYNFTAQYAERLEVPDYDINADKPICHMAEITDTAGWREVYGFAVPHTDKFSEIKLCLKTITNGAEIFGVKTREGKLYSAGFGGGEKALELFCEECYKFLLPRVIQNKGGEVK